MYILKNVHRDDNYKYLYWFSVYSGISYLDTNIYPNIDTITGITTIVIGIDYINECPKYGRECLVHIQNKNIFKVDVSFSHTCLLVFAKAEDMYIINSAHTHLSNMLLVVH